MDDGRVCVRMDDYALNAQQSRADERSTTLFCSSFFFLIEMRAFCTTAEHTQHNKRLQIVAEHSQKQR